MNETKSVEELQEILKTKNEIISKQSEQLLRVRSERDGAIQRAEKAESEASTKEELRAKWYGELQQAKKDIEFVRGQRDTCYSNLKKEKEKNFDLEKATKRDLITELLKRFIDKK